MSSTKLSDSGLKDAPSATPSCAVRDPLQASAPCRVMQCVAYLGIDVSKATLDVALLRLGKLKHKAVANHGAGFASLVQWLAVHGVELGTLHVCLEATGPYGEACATALADAGCVVSVVNPARIKGFGQSELIRNKTDAVDAGLIARFCAAMHPSAWAAPTPEQRKLRALVDRVQALQDNLQQERNRQSLPVEVADARVSASLAAHVQFLERAIAQLRCDIDAHIDGNALLKHSAALLVSIDAVGAVTAAKVLAYAGDVSRFDSAKAFSAFVGVAPRQKRSGSSVRGRSVMGKGGSNALRHALFMPAMVAMRHNKVVVALAERLKARGLKGKAIIGAAMHKLAHLIYGVLHTQTPYRADWAKTAQSLQPAPADNSSHASQAKEVQPPRAALA